MKRRKYLAVLSAAAITTLLTTSVFAANGDIYKLADKSLAYNKEQMVNLKNQNYVGMRDSQYGYEYNGKVYNLGDVNKTYAEEKEAGNLDLVTILNKVSENKEAAFPVEEEEQELKVESVSAIDTTVYKAEADQVLKVEINGNKEVTVAELVEAGYSVSFAANKSVFDTTGTTSTTGKLVSNFNTITDFNYSVTVTKGEETFESPATGKVTVVDSTAIKTIDEVELQNAGGDAIKSNTLTLTNNDFKVAATKGTNIKGEEETTFNPTYKSSDNTVALVGADGTITPVSAGTVTITVTQDKASKAITLTVTDAARALTTVKADVTSVDIVEGATKEINVTAFDQFGDAIATGGLTVASAKEAIATITKSVDVATVTGVAKGSTTATIKAGDKTISLPVTVGEAKIDSYKLEIATVEDQSDDKVIDVAKTDKDDKVTLVYNAYNATGQLVGGQTLKAYDGTGIGYKVVQKDTTGSKVDSGIVTVGANDITDGKIHLTALKAGTVEVTIYDGALAAESVTITVNNTTPTVTGATFIKDAKVTTTDATPVLKTSGLNFTAATTDAKFTSGKITKGDTATEYGSYDIVSNIPGATLSVVDGELALTVTPENSLAVNGTVSVRIKDNKGKIVSVGTIEVAIPAQGLTIAEPSSLTKTKEYDGDTTVVVTAGELTGVADGDEVAVIAEATYDNENVGTGKTITVVYTLGGADAAKYTAPEDTVLTDGEITAKELTIASGLEAVYTPADSAGQGTISFTGTPVLTGVVGGDEVSVEGVDTATGSIEGETDSETVTISGLSLTGAKADNYTLKVPTDLTVDATVTNP